MRYFLNKHTILSGHAKGFWFITPQGKCLFSHVNGFIEDSLSNEHALTNEYVLIERQALLKLLQSND